MLRIPLYFILAASLTQAAFSAITTDEVWPLPALPPNANPATVPRPREEWVLRVQTKMEQTKGKQYDLVFDGDSITDFWQGAGKAVWMAHYGGQKAIDFGIAADRVENLLWRLQVGQMDGVNPKLVVLMIGTNNASTPETVDQISEGISKAVGEYLKTSPGTHLLLLAVFPRSPNPGDPLRKKVAEINQKIASLQSDRVTYLDIGPKFLQPDGTLSKEIMRDYLHPTEKGYQIWADAIQPVVDQYVPKAAGK